MISLPISELLFSRTWSGEKAKKEKARGRRKKMRSDDEEEEEEEDGGVGERRVEGMSFRVAKSEHGGAGKWANRRHYH